MTPDEPRSDRKSSKRRRKRKTSSVKTGAIEHPNAFVCFRLKNPELVSALSVVQDEIREKHEVLKNTLIEPSTFHVTLAVLRLTEETEKTVVDLLEKTCSEFGPFTLEFDGLSCFSDRVVYANVVDNHVTKELLGLQEHLIRQFVASELTLFNHQEFTAHATVLKLSKDKKLRNIGYRSIPDNVYAEYASRYFGKQIVDELLLCKMVMADSEEDRFYQLIGKASLVIAQPKDGVAFTVRVEEGDVALGQNGEAPLDEGKPNAVVVVNGYQTSNGHTLTETATQSEPDSIPTTEQNDNVKAVVGDHLPTTNGRDSPILTKDAVNDRFGDVNGDNVAPIRAASGMTEHNVAPSQSKVEISRTFLFTGTTPDKESSACQENATGPDRNEQATNDVSSQMPAADNAIQMVNGDEADAAHIEGQTVEGQKGPSSLLPSKAAGASEDRPSAIVPSCSHVQSDCAADISVAKQETKKKKWTVRRLLSRLVACTKIQSRE